MKWSSVISGRLLVVCLVCAAGPAMADPASVSTLVGAYHNDTAGSSSAVDSSATPGAAIWVGSQANAYLIPPQGGLVASGTVTSYGSAASDFGINRVGVAGGLVYVAPSSPGETANPGDAGASASSEWQDVWTISGVPAGTLVHGTVFGQTDFDLSILDGLNPAGSGNPVFTVEQDLSVGDAFLRFTLDAFRRTVTPGVLRWSLDFTATAGQGFAVSDFLASETDPSFCGIDTRVSSTCTFAFDARHTSLFTNVVLDVGTTVAAASGQLVRTEAGFDYVGSLAEISAVPEPSTGWLLLSGMLLLARWSSWWRRS